MYKDKTVYAVYRLLYGEDFIKESIESIIDYVDKIFVFWSNEPFYKVKGVTYNNEYIQFPDKFDNSIEIIKSIKSDKIVLINHHFMTNKNSFTKMYNEHILVDYDECDILMMIEVDHVFREDQLVLALDEFIEKDCHVATTEQWEIWKGFNYCVPQFVDPKVPFDQETIDYLYKNVPTDLANALGSVNPRLRLCTMFLDMQHYGLMPQTGMHCNPVNTDFVSTKVRLKARTHNFGFAVSEKTMYWKHLISIAVSNKLGDTPPNIDWYEKKWLNWKPEDRNLEQSSGFEWHIPICIPYDTDELPESIKKKFLGK